LEGYYQIEAKLLHLRMVVVVLAYSNYWLRLEGLKDWICLVTCCTSSSSHSNTWSSKHYCPQHNQKSRWPTNLRVRLKMLWVVYLEKDSAKRIWSQSFYHFSDHLQVKSRVFLSELLKVLFQHYNLDDFLQLCCSWDWDS